MKMNYGFIEFESIKEFKEWLDKQKIARKINKLQVHHTAAPAYENWATDNALRRQYNIRNFHMKNNGWGDIAQHLTIFPNGHIVTGRSLESTPIGIKGWNSGAICIEIYGNFDVDVMNKEQKESVIAVYALLSNKFDVLINTNGIRPHCWFSYDGIYLGDYNKVASAKTCPGTNFMGIGNTKKAFKDKFYPLIEKYKYEDKTKYFKVIADRVNIHNEPNLDEKSISGALYKGSSATIIEEIEREGTNIYKAKAGYYITSSSKYVEVFEK